MLQASIISKIRKDNPGTLILHYLDDGLIVGPIDSIFKILVDIRTEFSTKLGLTLSLRKCKAHVSDPSFQPQLMDQCNSHGITYAPDGLNIVGSFVGTEEGSKAFIQAKVNDAIKLSSTLADIYNSTKDKGRSNAFSLYSLLRTSITSKYNYLWRTMPLHLTKDAARLIDNEHFRLVNTVFNLAPEVPVISPPLPPNGGTASHASPTTSPDNTTPITPLSTSSYSVSRDLLFLPLGHGGAGLPCMEDNCFAASIGSIAQTGPTVHAYLSQAFPITTSDMANLVPDFLESYTKAQQLGVFKQELPPESLFDASPQRGVQRETSGIIARNKCKNIEERITYPPRSRPILW